ncbi:helix-turn-helix transcriptional regulator [Rhodococcus koreensis]
MNKSADADLLMKDEVAVTGSVMERARVGSHSDVDAVENWQRMGADSLIGDQLWPTTGMGDFQASLRRRWVDDLLFVDFDTTGFAGRFVADSPAAQYIGLGFTSSKVREHLTFRDNQSTEVTNGFFAWDVAYLREFTQVSGGNSGYVYIPRSVLPSAAIRQLVGTGFRHLDGPSIRVLRGLVESVHTTTEPLDSGSTAAVRNAVVELLIGASFSDVAQSTAAVSDMMRVSIERWIRTNLQFGGITPAAAAAAHGISVRSLHRLFTQTEQSFGSVVRQIRLDHARQDLLRLNEPVQATAMRWGYADASHFCREFKKVYVLTPSEYRRHNVQLTS